ncbi:EamA family transporter [Micromonospora sp. LOL_015]|uniref:EamA family transporter n=1 Tax=Micromonospora sp. LOL_015 TaxID=3345416 RepID=UPI003A89152F
MSWLLTWEGAVVALWLGRGATAVPYLLWIRSLRTTAASSATAVGLAEPLTATALGIFLLDEGFIVWTIAGMVAIVVGLMLISRDSTGGVPQQRTNVPGLP